MLSSTIRRYNLPTCTLKIGKKNTPRFNWLETSNQEKIYFELHFNDPKDSQTEQIVISGDREKLQQLCVAVNNYVQQFLALTPAKLSLKLAKKTISTNTYNPSLQPKSLLAHQLFLGCLATQRTGNKIELSALQLFDLATALDRYATDPIAREQNIFQKARSVFPLKTGVAAVSLLLLGLSAICWRLFNSPIPQTETISSSSQTEAESNLKTDRPFEVLAPPPPQSQPQPKPSLPTTTQIPASNTAELETSPPTPPPGSTTRQPGKNLTRSRQINPKLPSLPALKPTDPISSQPFIISRDSESKQTTKESSREAQKADNSQEILAEVNNYLKQKWQPPKDLKRNLEYRLIIAGDGSLERAIPLGYAAKIYRDRTGIPLEGETFVSPISTRDKLAIRVFLIRDGSVKTFLE